MGVRRAVELCLDAPQVHADPICTYGPLIHNPQVLGLFEEKASGSWTRCRTTCNVWRWFLEIRSGYWATKCLSGKYGEEHRCI